MKDKILVGLFVALLASMFGSCDDNNSIEVELREVVKYADGSEVLILRTSSGKVIDSIPSKDGVKHGLRMHRNLGDTVIHYLTYNEGKVTGPCRVLDSGGRLVYEGAFLDSAQIGEWFFYHENGVVSSYEYFNKKGRIFLRTYDTSGIVLENMGEGLFSYSVLNADSANLGAGYVAEIMCAQPPNSEVILFYGDTTSSDRFELEIENNRAVFAKIFDEVGEYTMTFVWGCDDTISKEISSTVIYRTINVIE